MEFLAGALYPLFLPPLSTVLGTIIFVPFMVGHSARAETPFAIPSFGGISTDGIRHQLFHSAHNPQ